MKNFYNTLNIAADWKNTNELIEYIVDQKVIQIIKQYENDTGKKFPIKYRNHKN